MSSRTLRLVVLATITLAACDAPSRTPSARVRSASVLDASVSRVGEVSSTFEAHGETLMAATAGQSVTADADGTRIDGRRGRLLRLARTTVSRGQSRLGIAGAGARANDGRLRRSLASGIVEHVATSPLGTEQTWSIAERPSGTGDLRVVVPVTDASYVGADARGLRFRAPGGESIYSHATFVDAAGVRTAVPATFVDGAIVLAVPAAILEGAKYPAVLDPTISAVITIPGALAGSTFPAYGDQTGVAIGQFSPTSTLVAYVDEADPAVTTLDALLVDGTGVTTGGPFRIATDAVATPPDASCNAASCLVVYATSSSVVARRVGPAGAVLDASPIVIASLGGPGTFDVHDEGTGWIVAWSDVGSPTGTASRVYVRRVAYDGTVLGTAPLDVGDGGGSASVTVASIGGTAVIAWDDTVGTSGRIRGTRVDAAGTLLDASPVTLVDQANSAESMPRLVRRTSDVVLSHYVNGYLVSGVLATTPGLSLGVTTSLYLSNYNKPGAIALASDGTTIEVAIAVSDYSYPFEVSRAVLDANLNSTGIVAWMERASAIRGLGVVFVPGGRMIVASLDREVTLREADTNGYDLQIATASDNERNLTTGASSTRDPSATYSTQFAVATTIDDASVGAKIGATRLTPVGAVVDAVPVVLVSATRTTAAQDVLYTSVTSHLDPSFFAAWSRRKYTWSTPSATVSIEGLAFATSGAANPGVLRSLSLSSQYPFDFLGGTTLYAVWSNGNGLLRTPITTSTVGSVTSIAYDSNSIFVNAASDDTAAVGSSTSALFAITASNMPPSVSHASADGMLDIARGTRSTLIVKRNGVDGVANTIQAALLNLSGTSTTRATFTVSTGAGFVGRPNVVFDGTYYDVFYVRGTTLYLVRVDEDGIVRDGVASIVAASGCVRDARVALATDRGGRVLVAYPTFDPTPGVRAMRVSALVIDWNGTGSGATNGTACQSVLDCASGYCVDGVCCNNACGNGVANDCQACSTTANGTGANGTCSAASSAITCRASAGICDAAETCDGVATTCPSDARVFAGTVCGGPSTGPCETAEMCDGVSVTCRPRAPVQGSPVCRAASGDCDVDERCTGSSTVCPPDLNASTSTVCRAANGFCDRAETCNGSKTCPADQPAFATTVCRSSASACDAPEMCTGSSFVCPADIPVTNGTVCRASNGGCDLEELCDGSSFACPIDTFRAATYACRPTSGGCDSAEYCSGVGPACPAVDSSLPPGTICRAVAGTCDVAEVCTGLSKTCPTDAMLPATTVCRPATSTCDIAETCSGTGRVCPSDRARVDGSSCSDGLVCNGAESCVAGACVEGEALVCSNEAPCLESTGECAVPTRPGGAAGCSVSTRDTVPPFAAIGIVVGWLALRRFRGLVRTLVRRRRATTLALLVSVLAVTTGCVCGVGAVPCDDACVDVGYDERNCGACGVSCGTGQCVDGACVGVPTTGAACDEDVQCIDGSYCNGIERCVGERCRAGDPVGCDDGLACTTDACDDTLGSCRATPNSSACGVTP